MWAEAAGPKRPLERLEGLKKVAGPTSPCADPMELRIVKMSAGRHAVVNLLVANSKLETTLAELPASAHLRLTTAVRYKNVRTRSFYAAV